MSKQVTLECSLCGKRALSFVDKKTGSMQCLHCGYGTSDNYGHSISECEACDNLSDDVKSMLIEENNKVWVPATLTLPFGIIHPIKVEGEMFWSFAPMVEIPEEQQKEYSDGEGGYYTNRYDREQTTLYKYFFELISDMNKKYG